MAPSPNPGPPADDDPLKFDGHKLTATDGSQNEIGSWAAASGKTGSTTADQAVKNFGPIPEGSYKVNVGNIQRWSDLPWYQKAASVVGRGEWRGGPAVWGYERVPIDGTMLGRGNFFIHGGWGPQTAGCIKILGSEGGFFNYLAGQKGSIPLTVNYGY